MNHVITVSGFPSARMHQTTGAVTPPKLRPAWNEQYTLLVYDLCIVGVFGRWLT
jgi:hypothetical protein